MSSTEKTFLANESNGGCGCGPSCRCGEACRCKETSKCGEACGCAA
jgi:hypothetical protein